MKQKPKSKGSGYLPTSDTSSFPKISFPGFYQCLSVFICR
jgi:hypothetical protein